MKIIAVSDLHGNLIDIPECDLLLIAGDICPASDHNINFQRAWLNTNLRDWLLQIPAKRIVAIAGNHDFIFQRQSRVPVGLHWSYLQDSGVEIDGLKIYGSPWTPWFYNWAFNSPQNDIGESYLRSKFASMPVGMDIIITHGPPFGYGDMVERQLKGVGSVALLERLEVVKPKIVVYGHIHSGHGNYKLGEIRLFNVSILDERYNMAYQVTEIVI